VTVNVLEHEITIDAGSASLPGILTVPESLWALGTR